MAEFVARSSTSLPPNPPRLQGNPEGDSRAIIEWMNAFYQNTVVGTGLLDIEYQLSGVDIDFDNEVPDPTATTIARAQATANEAISRANQANNGVAENAAAIETAQGAAEAAQGDADTAIARLDALPTIITGTFTISDADTTAALTFSEALPSAAYRITATANAYTGSPTVTSFGIAAMAKSTTGVTFTLVSAPGVGASVTYDFILIL